MTTGVRRTANSSGSTSLATDAQGSLVSRQLYTPYGEVRYAEGTLPTDYGFTGQRKDGTIKLLHYNARFYDPWLGRFVSADTIVPEPGNPQSLNRYSYVVGNPLKYIDPSGHRHCVDVDENGRCIAWENPRTGEIEEVGGGDGGEEPPLPPPPPWYAPVEEFVHKYGFDRLSKEPGFQLGVVTTHTGKAAVATMETPFATLEAWFHLSIRLDAGDSSGPRVDNTKLTLRPFDDAEMWASRDDRKFGLVFKRPGEPYPLGRGFEFKATDKFGGGAELVEPIDFRLVNHCSQEFQVAYRPAAVALKVEPSLTTYTTVHSGPSALVVAPVAAYFGWPYVVGTLGLLSQFGRQGGLVPGGVKP